MRGLGLGQGVLALGLVAACGLGCSGGDRSTEKGRDISGIGKPSEMKGEQGDRDSGPGDDSIPSTNPNEDRPDAHVAKGDGGVPKLERCGDGMDDDGDGLADDGCACKTAEVQRCYAGSIETAGIGNCTLGTQLCDTSG